MLTSAASALGGAAWDGAAWADIIIIRGPGNQPRPQPMKQPEAACNTASKTTKINTHFKNFVAGFQYTFDFVMIVSVIKDQRMQIAVASMKYVGDAQTVLG